MLHYIFLLLVDKYHALNVVRYITFRAMASVFTALILSFIIGPKIIRWLKSVQSGGQPIREDGPESHLLTKKGTPTMGGIMIIISLLITTLLWADLSNPYIWISSFIIVSFATIGFLDDYQKLKYKNSKGISGKTKLLWQFIISFFSIGALNYYSEPDMTNLLFFPFYKNLVLDLGLFYFIFGSLVVVGCSNAVNLTDGLDGLATLPIIIATSCFVLISYLAGNFIFANYLQIPFIPKSGELAILGAAMIGSCLGFLWYNAHPAKIFMGDIGSLSMGATIGIISVMTKHELVLFIVGGLFVIEALSVIIQVGSYKMRQKRVFKMAPIHHHFEKLGWSETTVVVRFWIIAIIFAIIGLSTLKLR